MLVAPYRSPPRRWVTSAMFLWPYSAGHPVPQAVDQRINRQETARSGRQEREQATRDRPGDIDLPSLGAHLKQPEHPHPHITNVRLRGPQGPNRRSFRVAADLQRAARGRADREYI